jgi:thiol-disulfide isomerase/thioredoxin
MRPGFLFRVGREEFIMSEDNFFERVKQNPHPVVVDFWAPWCGLSRGSFNVV